MTKKITSLVILLALFAGARIVSADWQVGLYSAGLYGLPDNSVTNIIDNTLLWILRIFTLLAVISFVVTGIMFLMSGSNTAMAEKAKAGVGYSIIGIVVGLIGYIVIIFVDSWLWGYLY